MGLFDFFGKMGKYAKAKTKLNEIVYNLKRPEDVLVAMKDFNNFVDGIEGLTAEEKADIINDGNAEIERKANSLKLENGIKDMFS